MSRVSILLFAVLSLLIHACASTPKTPAVKETATAVQEKPLDIFNRILDISTNAKDRQAVLPEIERLYKRIITEYPDAPLAQESYWRLISIYLEECSPPAFKEAEGLYEEFSKRHPDSIFKNMIIETLGKAYYKAGDWKKLLEISTPVFNRYIKDGTRPGSLMLLMYSEANFRLGSLGEAKKGYELVIQLYPILKNNKTVKARLYELRGKEHD